MRRAGVGQPTRLRSPDAIGEAFAVIVARPARTIAASLATLLAIAWFVAVPGLVSTANSQVAMAFTQRLPTQVRVTPRSAGLSPAAYPYPPDVDRRLKALHGVVAAGVFWEVKLAVPVVVSSGLPGSRPATGPTVIAASAGFLSAAGIVLSQGRLFSRWAVARAAPVCLVGSAAARSLGVTTIGHRRSIFINNEPCVVIGIFDHALRQPALRGSVLIPTSTAVKLWGPPDQQAGAKPTVLIQTRPGAALTVARRAPFAISQTIPQRFVVHVRVPPQLLRDQVNATLDSLFSLVGWVSLAIGTLSIAIATWLSVRERTPEFALRRAVGARRRHVAIHVMWESAITGLLGGLAGASLGLAVVVLIAHARHWTPVIAPLSVLPAPLAGAAAGILAGLIPAFRAARIAPALELNTVAAA